MSVTADIPCYYTDIYNISVPLSKVGCPSPLIYDAESNFCTVGCPLPYITESEYQQLETMMSVLGWLSFVLTAFLLLTAALDPEKRHFPAMLPNFFIFCINATSFAFCLGSMVGHEQVWCKDDGTPNDFGGGACTVQGYYFFLFSFFLFLFPFSFPFPFRFPFPFSFSLLFLFLLSYTG